MGNIVEGNKCATETIQWRTTGAKKVRRCRIAYRDCSSGALRASWGAHWRTTGAIPKKYRLTATGAGVEKYQRIVNGLRLVRRFYPNCLRRRAWSVRIVPPRP